MIEELRHNGIIVLPGYFSEYVDELQAEHRLALKDTALDPYNQRVYSKLGPVTRIVGNNIYIRTLTQLYMGQPQRISVFRGKRLEPVDPVEHDAYQWHRDGEGRQLRLMVYLTDVTMDDQRMDYMVGSHADDEYRKCVSRINDYFRLYYLDRYVHPCVGIAGTAILFDREGLHRGNRTPGAVRDSINFRYASDTIMSRLTDAAKRILAIKARTQMLIFRRQPKR